MHLKPHRPDRGPPSPQQVCCTLRSGFPSGDIGCPSRITTPNSKTRFDRCKCSSLGSPSACNPLRTRRSALLPPQLHRPPLHRSITPSLHHSIAPSLHRSITPSLHYSTAATPPRRHAATPPRRHAATPPRPGLTDSAACPAAPRPGSPDPAPLSACSFPHSSGSFHSGSPRW